MSATTHGADKAIHAFAADSAIKEVEHDANFKQSRDVREDRSQRQAKPRHSKQS